MLSWVSPFNIITAVFLYDLFGHYSYDDFGVMRAPLSIRLTLGGHYRTSAFKRSARWQASERSPLWTYTLTLTTLPSPNWRLLALIQTEAERRRREAGVKQSMEIRLGSCMWVGGWVCMVFGIISRTKARSAINEIPNCRSPERALLRHHIIGVRLPTSARRAKLPK